MFIYRLVAFAYRLLDILFFCPPSFGCFLAMIVPYAPVLIVQTVRPGTCPLLLYLFDMIACCTCTFWNLQTNNLCRVHYR